MTHQSIYKTAKPVKRRIVKTKMRMCGLEWCFGRVVKEEVDLEEEPEWVAELTHPFTFMSLKTIVGQSKSSYCSVAFLLEMLSYNKFL